MKNLKQENLDECSHENVKRDGGFFVCQDCGLILDENVDIATSDEKYKGSSSQLDYERNLRIRNSKAKQDPIIKQKYDKIKTLERWYRDYQSSFTEQKHTIELLKSYLIGLNIDQVKYQQIKKRYLKYNKNHRKTYQNMVIIFLAIVWMEIKETTNIRIEKFIEVCNELGHKINKKMLNHAFEKVKKTETMMGQRKNKSKKEIEKEIKKKVKILFQKNLNDIPYDKVKEHIPSRADFDKLKVEMQLLVDKLLSDISYENLKNLNYKAFTAGLIYYIGQTLNNRKIFIQSLIEETTSFSSTTIRKKYHILKDILGDPHKGPKKSEEQQIF